MKFFGLTDKGVMRKSNQDRYALLRDEKSGLILACVCDGMGGANGGEVASSIAIGVVDTEFKKQKALCQKHSHWSKTLISMAEKANTAIYSAAGDNSGLHGMGTTFVAVLCKDNKITAANVGDSRAYIITEDGITQLTKDHSLVGEMLQSGHISVAEANTHPNKNVITRALGVENSVKCDIYNTEIKPGQYILLCSDGLTEEVSEPEIHFEVCNSSSVEEACRSLVKIANLRGGHDNISVVIGGF